ncbi:MAG: carboxypeptidase regulatory-like domain-containing protein [Patescibacteria group bacterium]
MKKSVKLVFFLFFFFGLFFALTKHVQAQTCVTISPPTYYSPLSDTFTLPSIGDKVTISVTLDNNCSYTVQDSADGRYEYWVGATFSVDSGNQSFYVQPPEQHLNPLASGASRTYYFTTTIQVGNTCTTSSGTTANVSLTRYDTINIIRDKIISSSNNVSAFGGVGSIVKGTIYKSDGSVASGATVTISPQDNSAGTTTTDANGFYIFRRIACTTSHTLSASLGGGTASKSLAASTANGGTDLCNGQERTHNLTLSPSTGTLYGYVFEDTDGSGVYNLGEPLVGGINCTSGKLVSGLGVTLTSGDALAWVCDGNGNPQYISGGNLTAGNTYTANLIIPGGWLATTSTSQSVYISPGVNNKAGDFGIAQLAAPSPSAKCANADGTAATVSWNAVSGATGYEFNMTGPGLNYNTPITLTSITVNGLTPGNSYSGYVGACNSAGCPSSSRGTYSAPVCYAPKTSSCPVPSTLTGSGTNPLGSPFQYGDVDGDGKISMLDTYRILDYIGEKITLTTSQIERADVINSSGRTGANPGVQSLGADVSALDAQWIGKFLNNEITTFPACGTAPTVPPTPTTGPTPVPCAVTTSPASLSLIVGGAGNVDAVVSSGLGSASITRMNFASNNTSIATVNPTSDTTPSPYRTVVTAVAAGSTAVRATADLSDGRTCSATSTITVTTPAPTYTIYIHAYLDEGAGPCYHNKIQDCGESYPAPWPWVTIIDPVGNNNSYIAGGGSYTSGALSPGTWYAGIDYNTGLYELEDPINYPASKTFTLGPNADINIPLLTIPTHSISGTIFIDNGAGAGGVANDGIKNGTEAFYPGTPVSMSVNGGTSSDRTLTNGVYTITGFSENQDHTINLTPPSGYVYSYSGADLNYVNPRTVAVTTSDVAGINFGIIPDPGFAISGNVFIDGDNDCIKDAGEANFAGAALINQSVNRNLGSDVISSGSLGTANRIRVSRITVPAAESGAVSQGSMYIQGSTNNATVYMVVYDDVSSQPKNLIAVSNGVSVPTTQAAGWVNFTFPSSFTFNTTASQNIWIGMYADITGTTGGTSGPLLFYSTSVIGDYASDGYVYVDDGDAPVPSDLTGIGFDSAVQRSYSAYLIVSPSPTSSTSVLGPPGYSFSALSAGTYNTTLTVPNDYTLSSTCTNPIPKTVPPTAADANFGIRSSAPTYSIIGDCVVDNPPYQTSDASDTSLEGTPHISYSNEGGTISGITTCSNGPYTPISVPEGKYFISYPAAPPPGYIPSFPPGTPPTHIVTVGPACDVGASAAFGASCIPPGPGGGGIEGLDFGFRPPDSWIQSGGTDIRFDSGLDNVIPSTAKVPPAAPGVCTAPFGDAFTSVNGAGGSPGIIFTGDSPAYFGPAGSASAPPANWKVGSAEYQDIYAPSKGIYTTSYAYVLGRVRQSGITPTNLSCTLLSCTLPALASGVYTAGSDVKIVNSSDYTLAASTKVIILIDGNLTIAAKIFVPKTSTLTFIVRGDIHIDKSIGTAWNSAATQVEGYYSADSDFIIDNNNDSCVTPDFRLNMAGTVIVNAGKTGGQFINNRTLCTNNAFCPVFTIKERPDFVLNAPESIKQIKTIYQEVAP